jgi:hypothetical protein
MHLFGVINDNIFFDLVKVIPPNATMTSSKDPNKRILMETQLTSIMHS